MFNLLPDSLKSDVKKEYNLRRLIVALFFVFSLEVTFVVFIFPSWIISNIKLDDNKARVEEIDKNKDDSDSNMVRPIIKSINNELGIIDKSLDYVEVSPVFNAILDKKTNSIKITQFSYTSTGSTTATATLRGISATRESLVNFKKNLDTIDSLKSVDLPISNYAKDRDIDFAMNIIISEKK
ncbi:MAG: hypothetical protein WAW92_01225 [Minisyncoccia bacterium]